MLENDNENVTDLNNADHQLSTVADTVDGGEVNNFNGGR